MGLVRKSAGDGRCEIPEAKYEAAVFQISQPETRLPQRRSGPPTHCAHHRRRRGTRNPPHV